MGSETANPETVTKTGFKKRMAQYAIGVGTTTLALISMVPPAAAVDVNLSVITDVINAFIGLLEPITNLIIAIVPLWFILAILGFIMGLLATVLGMIKIGGKKV